MENVTFITILFLNIGTAPTRHIVHTGHRNTMDPQCNWCKRPTYKKAQALRAKAKSNLRIAQFQLSKNGEYCLKLLFPFCYIP
jgi:hypothetical protein